MRVLRIFSKIKQPELCKTYTHNIIKRGNDNGPSLLFSSYDVTIAMKRLYFTVFKKRWIGPPIFRWLFVLQALVTPAAAKALVTPAAAKALVTPAAAKALVTPAAAKALVTQATVT